MVSLAGSLAGLIPNNHQQYLQKLQQQQQQQQHHDELDESFMTTINGRQQRRNRSGVTLGQEQKFLLIEHIRERPQIWDANNDGFRSNQSRQAAFNEVAQLLSNEEEQFTRIQIQEEWGKLRYCFTRIVKKLLEEAGGGQISEEQLATVTWAFFRPMAFLLEAVLQQLQSQPGCEKCESHGAEDGHEGGGGGEAEHQQENVAKSDGSPQQMKPPKMRLRRRRRANVSRKNSGNSSGADFLKLEEHHLGEEEQHQQQQPPNIHSTNELLMSQVLGLANAQAQEQLLMANIQSAMQSSQQFLQQLKKQEGEESAAAVQGNTARMAVAQQQRQPEQSSAAKATLQQQQQQREERMFRRKRKGSNLDFLLDSALARPGEVGHSPLGQSTPAKSSQLLLGANAGEFTSPAQTIADSIANSSPQQQQQNGEEVIVLEERAAGGDREGSASGSAGGGGGAGALEEDINESFGRYIVQQLKSVSKKNELFSVQLRKELVDVCYKYEVKACTEGN